MSKERKTRDTFPHVAGLAKKRTKFGHRWILTEHDSTGKSHSITVKILDNDPVDVFYRKVSEARRELRQKTQEKDFSAYLKEYFVIKQLSQNTKEIYTRTLNGFSFDEKQNKKRVHELLSKDVKASTLKVYVSKVDAFFSWLIQRGEHIKNPVCDVTIKAKLQPRKRIITDDELEKLLSYARRHKDKSYTLFILLLIETGARVSTIIALQPKDLSEDGHIHLVNVKSKKDYDYSLKIENDEIKALWAQRVKAKKMWNDLPRRYWKRLIQFMRHTFGKDENGERLSPHSLRHSFASRAIQNGASLEVVSKLLDHASPSTTLRVYARFSQEQIDDGMRRAMIQKSSCVGGIQTHEPDSTMKTNTQTHKKAVASEQN